MKVKVARQSGRPVDLNKIEEFEEEFKKEYDILFEKYSKDMITMNDELTKLDSRMNEKYDTVLEWDFPNTIEAWKKIESDYGAILVSTHNETKDLIFIILDQGI